MAQIRLPSGEIVDKIYVANASDIGGGTGGGGGTVMPSTAFASGTLASTQYVQAMAGAPLPATATLTSTNVSRAIEVSSSGTGGPWRIGDYDVNDSVGLVLVIESAVTHVRFTGAVGDAWSVL